jgi:hypothetical protein
VVDVAIVDAGALFAWAADNERMHYEVVRILEDESFRFIISGLALAEATYLALTRIGPHAEVALVDGMARP